MCVQPFYSKGLTPVIMGRFAGRTWKNGNKWYTYPPELYNFLVYP